MDSKPNIQDVARLADVSIATVSRVINNQGGVRKVTEDRILKAIEELGYIRNAAARTMKRKETNTIGVIVPDIKNPFFPLVMAGIEQKAREKDYFTILSSTNESPIIEEKIVKNFIERGVDGVIITTANENGEHLKLLQEQNIPIVAVDRSIRSFEVDTVLVDNIKGSYQAVQHLILQGHRKIAIICGPQNTTPGFERYIGYKKALEDYNIPLDERLVVHGDFGEHSGYLATRQLNELDERPTAIFSSNNLMTIGCMKALDELNWKLGDEVAFMGFDDVDIATFLNPKLSVVTRPMNAVGEIAFTFLHERIHFKNDLPKRKYSLPPELIIRQSCRLVRL
ncbi:LacI family DNA-binding transcriptional regulator [Bacillus sp. EB106-08-02-XG196]|jgi:LacI family transcriptional regulator|uniref:LacI family DNA-binding transcriptional regulator n=1 Tax=Bacillus sp. EB106-08-02-XG196 TaxID=2737049 RepID=UPI0015C4CB18|nr:LacI family DNA-binding transcriptional regulator [Bacillus sp. EB106-08-02-XG196]NWQ44369.1 LacI family DNA-binding transcriptional regulator [Bacillus sp. EB106-08-02-XG196]